MQSDTEVRERRSASWARIWMSKRPIGGRDRSARMRPHPRDDEIEQKVAGVIGSGVVNDVVLASQLSEQIQGRFHGGAVWLEGD